MAKSNPVASLYLVATPIGNMADMTKRSRDILSDVDVILCERPTHSQVLLKHYLISPKRMAKLTDHDRLDIVDGWLDCIVQGQNIAYISDAGTPLISDPGSLLVERAHSRGIHVVSVPGASAVTTAVSLSGFCGKGYAFYGFLPAKSSARLAMLSEQSSVLATVYFESPHRLLACLADMLQVFGPERKMMVAKELTKVYESYWVGSVADCLDLVQTMPIKGEYVLVVAPDTVVDTSDQTKAIQEVLSMLFAEGLTLQQAVAVTTKMIKARKNDVYKQALAFQKTQDDNHL